MHAKMRFFALDRKHPFWANLVQKIKTAEFNSDVHFFGFQPEITFLGKFGPKNQNCPFKLKFGTYSPGHNILKLDNFLVQVRFASSKTKLDI